MAVDSHDMLVCTVGATRCALPLMMVEETMRPLPIQRLTAAPPFVLGLALIRGIATPVIDASHVLTQAFAPTLGRFVSLKLGTRRAALAVDSVVGVRKVTADGLSALPPLLSDVSSEVVSAVTRLDGELLLVLRASKVFFETGATP